MRRLIIILIIIFACLLWLESPDTAGPGLRPRKWQGEGRESVVSTVISSSIIAFTWGMPAALIFQLRALLE